MLQVLIGAERGNLIPGSPSRPNYTVVWFGFEGLNLLLIHY